MAQENVPKEIWKDIEGYERMYQVSNLGRCKSLDREIIQFGHKTYYARIMKGRIIRLRKQRGGYYLATLTKGNNEKKKTIHRLVAEAFIPNPENKKQINHINGDKSDNRAENLEWVTQSENMRHSYEILGHKRRTKKIYCIELKRTFNSIREASRELNINSCSISNVLKHRSKTAGGFTWTEIKD